MHDELARIGHRLNQPIRIALAGTLKAGKSTLVNALVGEDIAPMDATEATRASSPVPPRADAEGHPMTRLFPCAATSADRAPMRRAGWV